MSDSEASKLTLTDVLKSERDQAAAERPKLDEAIKDLSAAEVMPADRERSVYLDRVLERKFVQIGDKEVECWVVNPEAEYQRLVQSGKEVLTVRKKGEVTARQASGVEHFTAIQDGKSNEYTTEAGDWVLKNPGDEGEYVFGDPNKDSLEVRKTKFAETYEPVPEQDGKYRRKKLIKAVSVDRPIVFKTNWGSEMAVDLGGVLTDGGYSIAASSMAKDYEIVDKAPQRD